MWRIAEADRNASNKKPRTPNARKKRRPNARKKRRRNGMKNVKKFVNSVQQPPNDFKSFSKEDKIELFSVPQETG